MKIQERKDINSTIFLKIGLDMEDLSPYYQKSLDYYRTNYSFNGYRPGFASEKVIQEKVGKEVLLEYAARHLVLDFLRKFLQENSIESLDFDPKIELTNNIFKDNKADFAIEIYLPAQVKLANYKNIYSKSKEIKVNDNDVNLAIGNIQKRHAILKESNEKIKEQDVVSLDFKIKIDGSLIKDGEKENFIIKIGEGSFIKEFEDNLLYLTKDSDKEFNFNFPKNFQDVSLRSKQAVAWVRIKKVEKEILPEINNDFVSSIGKFKNVEDFREALKKDILENKKNAQKREILGRKVKELIDKSEFFIPEVLIIEEENVIYNEIKRSLEKSNLNFEDWQDRLSKDTKMLDKIRQEADSRVKARLILEEIAKRENISPTQEEISNFLNTRFKYDYNNEIRNENKEFFLLASKKFLIQEKVTDFLLSY